MRSVEFIDNQANQLEGTPIHLLLASAILTHALAGCCAHAAPGDCPDCTCESEHRHSHDQHDTGKKNSNGSAVDCGTVALLPHCLNTDEPAAPRQCQHARCSWTAPEARDAATQLAASYECSLVAVEVVTATVGTIRPARAEYRLCNRPCPLPVRAHLAKQVFLI